MSKLSHLRKLSITTAISAGIGLGMVNSASASVLHNGWNYAIDSFSDSTSRAYIGGPTVVGGGVFEGHALALKDDIENNKLTFAINANLPQDGAVVPFATGYSHVGWGDFFIQTAQGLLGVNFTTANDSAAAVPGLYQVTSTKSVATANDGWPTNTSYTNAVISKGKNPTMGDLAQNQSPFGNATDSVMASAVFLDNIATADLTGIDFGHFGATGSQTFGFSINRSLVTPGNIVAWLIAECGNEWMALLANIPEKPPIGDPENPDNNDTTKSAPEPSALVGMLALVTMGFISAKKKQQQQLLIKA